ncbi:formyl transferase family protein [Microcystis aeruginosa FACHB-905 = DIANCHI905]|nr:formyl transferase family protein [Microcystis aeruginosa FACHB-905 = DIANCHI905]
MRVIAIGRSEYLLNTIREIADQHELVGIVTGPATPESLAKEADFEQLARTLKCGFLFAKQIDQDCLQFCKSLNADIAISVNWMSVIRDDFISIFPKGVLNAHCGDLPKYRGNAILNWAILNKENEITVSVHNMVANELDMGTVWAQERFAIKEADYIGDLVSKMGEITPKVYVNALRNLCNNKPLKTFEEVRRATGFRCYPRMPEDGCIDWQQSAESIERLIRASSKPYPGAFTAVVEQGTLRKLVIWKARVVDHSTPDFGVPGHIIKNCKDTGESWVYTGAGILALQEVQLEDGEITPPGKHFKSIRMRLGISQGLLIELLQNTKLP